MSPRARGTRPSIFPAAPRTRRRSSSCTAGRSYRSPGASSCRRSRPWAFAPLRPTCAATDARASIRATRTTRSKRSSPTWSSSWTRSGPKKAIWVGHDWGSPVVWSIAQHHPDLCHGVANLCVPYQPDGFAVETVVPLADRNVYPADKFPAAQWDYQMFYRENFAMAEAGFEGDVGATVRVLFRSGNPSGKGKPARTAFVRANGGWFRRRELGPRCAARRGLAERGGRAPLCRRARTQRVFRPLQLVHELEGQSRLRRTRESQLAARDAGAVPACARTTISARRWSRASPSRCAPIATT